MIAREEIVKAQIRLIIPKLDLNDLSDVEYVKSKDKSRVLRERRAKMYKVSNFEFLEYGFVVKIPLNVKVRVKN